jgi:hypothetical protein
MRSRSLVVAAALILPVIAAAQEDSVKVRQAPDSSKVKQAPDSSKIRQAPDSSIARQAPDSSKPLHVTDTAVAQQTPIPAAHRHPMSQEGRTIITFGLGLTGTREASVGGGHTSASATGQLVSMAFSHYVSPGIAFDMAASVLEADASTGFNSATTNAVTALLFGLSYSPPQLAFTKGMRPYVSAAMGPYTHVQAEKFNGSNSTTVQSHVGARFGAGMNISFAHIFALQIQGDYHSVRPFDSVNGVTRDAAGPSMSIGFGFGWGGK